MVIKIVTLVSKSERPGACFESEGEKVLCGTASMSAQKKLAQWSDLTCVSMGAFYHQIVCNGRGPSIGAVTVCLCE